MFKVGDLVRLKNGKAIMKVLEIGTGLRENTIRAQYLSRLDDKDYYHHQPKWRVVTDYVHIDTTAKESEPMSKLYETVGEPTMFGTKIATNSQGQYVLEMKGKNGEVKAYDPSDLKEVLPYTVTLEMLANATGERRTSKDVMTKPGQVEKNDIMLELCTGLIWRVSHVDSQCRSPNENKSKWLKLPTEAIAFGAAE